MVVPRIRGPLQMATSFHDQHPNIGMEIITIADSHRQHDKKPSAIDDDTKTPDLFFIVSKQIVCSSYVGLRLRPFRVLYRMTMICESMV